MFMDNPTTQAIAQYMDTAITSEPIPFLPSEIVSAVRESARAGHMHHLETLLFSSISYNTRSLYDDLQEEVGIDSDMARYAFLADHPEKDPATNGKRQPAIYYIEPLSNDDLQWGMKSGCKDMATIAFLADHPEKDRIEYGEVQLAYSANRRFGPAMRAISHILGRQGIDVTDVFDEDKPLKENITRH